MIVEWLSPLLEWTGFDILGLLLFLLVVIGIIKLIKD